MLASMKLADVPALIEAPLQTGEIIARRLFQAARKHASEKGIQHALLTPAYLPNANRPGDSASETVICKLTRRSGLKLTAVNPEATDLCHAGMRAIRLELETMTHQRTRQRGRPERASNPCRILNVPRRFDDDPAPGVCL